MAFRVFYASLDVGVDQGRGGSNDDMNLPIFPDDDWSDTRCWLSGGHSRSIVHTTHKHESYPEVLINSCRRAPVKLSIIHTVEGGWFFGIPLFWCDRSLVFVCPCNEDAGHACGGLPEKNTGLLTPSTISSRS